MSNLIFSNLIRYKNSPVKDYFSHSQEKWKLTHWKLQSLYLIENGIQTLAAGSTTWTVNFHSNETKFNLVY